MTKPSICVTLPKEYKEWLEKKVKKQDYGSISHGITQLIRDQISREGSAKKNE
jgi:Arc/MetJ-type ribon-helix-helix transcriptional regulator